MFNFNQFTLALIFTFKDENSQYKFGANAIWRQIHYMCFLKNNGYSRIREKIITIPTLI